MVRIPKIIHYCWFGGNSYPDLMVKCLESWKKYCPDYEIKQWNESNFDVSCNVYVRQAYEAQRWAFVTDYVRLHALYTQGGIYMDTDVEVVRQLDDFLSEEGFSGFENARNVPTGLMASEQGHPFIGELLREYEHRTFLRMDGSQDCNTNVESITAAALRHGLKQDGSKQTVFKFTFYPTDFFCPIDFQTKRFNPTSNTYAIHHFNGSWLTKDERKRQEIYRHYSKIIGKRLASYILVANDVLKTHGLIRTIGKIIAKIFCKIRMSIKK